MTTREAVIAEALSWIGTPFHDRAGVKGAGVDCVHFLKCVFVNVGAIADFDIEAYPPQWFVHSKDARFLRGIQRYAHRVEVGLPGDVAMYNYGLHAAHGAIIIDERTIVHAWRPARCVTKASYLDMRPCLDSLWSVF